MIYFVKITDQGQISIPAEIRRLMGGQNLVIEFDTEKREFIAKQAPNILSYAGKFKNKAIKGKKIDEIIKIENNAITKAATKKYIKNVK